MAGRLAALGWLIPRAGESGRALGRRTRLLLTLQLVMANALGTVVVFALCVWGFPLPEVEDADTVWVVNVVALGLVPVAMAFGTAVGLRKLAPARAWLEADRPPTDAERLAVLRAPLTIARVHAALWALGALFFGALNAILFSGELGQRIAITVALGGITTSAVSFLVAERQLRPEAARALAANPLEHPVGPGIKGRSVIAWAVGTGIPGLGVVLVAVSTLVERDFTARELAITVLALAAVALVFGLYVYRLATRAIADPVLSVRDAMGAVERGELEVEVPVYDGSEVGLLQAGFNRMAAGLRERERIRDRFGRHVGEEVARVALEQDAELGGETRTVAILFCDVVGSTEIAAERDPHDVVELLNSFFAIVVEVVREHGGWVNKFEGDAALAVFGAPAEVEDAAGCALAAARALSARLRELPDVEAGVGVAYGEVVAGNVGEESRFEYTVIGDPVNEAARLTELAKSRPGMVVAAATAVGAASADEARRWELGESVELRGRSAETRLATPRLDDR